MEPSRAWAEVDLAALGANLGFLQERVGPNVGLCLVAKADAYGHGAVEIAREATRMGVRTIAVTSCAEAAELRNVGVRARLLVLSPLLDTETGAAVRSGYDLCVSSEESLATLEAVATRFGRRPRVHLKVDTGMGRLGVAPPRAARLMAAIQGSSNLELVGLMSHLAASEGALSPTTDRQARAFATVLAEARTRGLFSGGRIQVHLANSAGVLSGLEPLFDMARVGVAAYGIAPDPSLATDALRPVLTVRTRIVHLCELAQGASAGYGGSWTAGRDSRLAVLPLGYADGVDGRLGNRGSVLVRGRRAPMVGRVSMDLTTIDVTDVPGAAVGDVTTVIGRDGAERIRVEDVARQAGTTPYQVTCSLGKRVRRVYVRGLAGNATPVTRSPVPA